MHADTQSLPSLSMPSPAMAHHSRSSDGTSITYERSGHGPLLVIVDGALCSRQFGPSAALAAATRRGSKRRCRSFGPGSSHSTSASKRAQP